MDVSNEYSDNPTSGIVNVSGHTSVESLYRCVDEMIAVEKTCLYLFGVVCVHECSSWLPISHTARIVGF